MHSRNLIILTYASMFLIGLVDNIRGPLFPEILREFSLSNSQGSWFFALTSGTIIIAGYLGAIFLAKFGKVGSLRLATVLLVLGILGIASLPSFQLILCAVVLFGFALGILGVAQNVLIIEASPPEHLHKLQSGLHSMYGLASLAAPLVVVFLFQLKPDWRWSFYFCAGIGALVLIASFFVLDFQHPATQASLREEQPPTSRVQQVFFASILATYVASELLVGTRIAQFSREYFQFAFADSARLTSLFFVMLFFGRLLYFFWQPQISLKIQMLFSLVGALILCSLGLSLHPFFLALSGLAMAPFYPMAMTVAGRLFPKEIHHVTSLAIALSGVTIMLGQLFVGALGDQFGLKVALLLAPTFSLIALLQIVQYKKFFKRDLP